MIKDRNDGAAFFVGLTVGGLLGSAVALLLAPRSGQETRTQIRDRSLKLREQAEKGVAEVRTRADAAATDVRQRVEDVQEQVARFQEQGRDLIEAQTGKVKDVTEKAKTHILEGN